jgi:hypothetical protein
MDWLPAVARRMHPKNLSCRTTRRQQAQIRAVRPCHGALKIDTT